MKGRSRDIPTAGANILKQFGIQSIRLVTNNPVKLQALAGHDLQIDERVSPGHSSQSRKPSVSDDKKEKTGAPPATALCDAAGNWMRDKLFTLSPFVR
jgi:GTP cyclohydrolase II